MAIHRVVLTYEDYLAMPDDGRRYETEVGAYRLAGRLQGDARVALPPFPDLVLGLDELWPPRSPTGATA